MFAKRALSALPFAAGRPLALSRSSVAGIRAASTIDPSKTEITKTTSPRPKTPKEKLLFGVTKSDHMLEIDWSLKGGWTNPRIVPYHNLELDPACSALHYGLEAFEGMKAYKGALDGKIRLFRPDLNMKRLSSSMDRLAFPELPKDAFIECIKQLVKIEAEHGWIPDGEGFSLYLRPTVIGTYPYLGVHAAENIKLYVIACPVGPYYPEGFKPVRLFADKDHVRAFPGGVGDCKVGGNYAPTIKVQRDAAKKGYTQVLWLFDNGSGEKEVTEVGTMNFFAFIQQKDGTKELVTPPLDGTILPGVTRQSILDLARQWEKKGNVAGGIKVSERRLPINEVTQASKDGRLIEAFGAGTAAVVSPIKAIHYDGTDFNVPLDPSKPNSGAGPLTQKFWDELMSIQYAKSKEHLNHPWTVLV